MKIRKAISVVLVLLLLVSYSNAQPLFDFCKYEKEKTKQCKKDLNDAKSECKLKIDGLNKDKKAIKRKRRIAKRIYPILRKS